MRLDLLLSFTDFIVGITLIVVILYRNKHAISIFLALFIFTNAYSNLINFFAETKYLLHVPFFFGTGTIAVLLRPITLYFYLRFLLNEKKRLNTKDVWHLVPLVLCIINYWPLLFSSNVVKQQVLHSLYQNDLSFYLNPSLVQVQPATVLLAISLLNLFYVFLIHRLIIKQNKEERNVLMKDKQVLTWIKILVFTFAITSLLGIIANFNSNYTFIWKANVWQSLIFCGIICIALLFMPNVLYGDFDSFSEGHFDDKSKEELPDDKHRFINIPEETSLLIEDRLKNYIEQRGYLQKNSRLAAVAKAINVQPYILSAYINQDYKMRFNDLINFYRVEYVKEGLLAGEWDQLTLEAIGEKAGFTNRTTFLNSFKKYIGTTPTQFLQQQKRNTNQ